jgi:hypothetical protein
MDPADAALVRVAEWEKLRQIFTPEKAAEEWSWFGWLRPLSPSGVRQAGQGPRTQAAVVDGAELIEEAQLERKPGYVVTL